MYASYFKLVFFILVLDSIFAPFPLMAWERGGGGGGVALLLPTTPVLFTLQNFSCLVFINVLFLSICLPIAPLCSVLWPCCVFLTLPTALIHFLPPNCSTRVLTVTRFYCSHASRQGYRQISRSDQVEQGGQKRN